MTKVHLEAVRFAREGYTIILIGHEGHDEVLGTMGEAPAAHPPGAGRGRGGTLELPPGARVAYLTQTTLSVDDAEVIIAALKRRFPHIVGPSRDDICYATQNRQEAVKELVPEADVVIVLGSQNSSNSMRLAEMARAGGKPAYLIDGVHEIPDGQLQRPRDGADHGRRQRPGGGRARSASAPCASAHGATVETRTVREEHVSFPLPRELRVLAASGRE